MWFQDMGTESMIAEGDHIRAIGWLSNKTPFRTGEVPPEFLERLKEFCRRWEDGLESLAWGIFMGAHSCELCHRFNASGYIGIPAGDVLYAAPEMVGHYVEAHQYSPPAVFIQAVFAAPLPGTTEYHDAVAKFRDIKLRQLAEWRATGQASL